LWEMFLSADLLHNAFKIWHISWIHGGSFLPLNYLSCLLIGSVNNYVKTLFSVLIFTILKNFQLQNRSEIKDITSVQA
jgi:hypothetical protein